MIKIHELKIGSYVESVHPDFKAGYFKVWAINPSDKSFKLELDSEVLDTHIKDVPLDYINPILLTSSMLVELGFEKRSNIRNGYVKEGLIIDLELGIALLDNGDSMPLLGMSKYVHQFQNVWTVYKNKTLQIKL